MRDIGCECDSTSVSARWARVSGGTSHSTGRSKASSASSWVWMRLSSRSTMKAAARPTSRPNRPPISVRGMGPVGIFDLGFSVASSELVSGWRWLLTVMLLLPSAPALTNLVKAAPLSGMASGFSSDDEELARRALAGDG